MKTKVKGAVVLLVFAAGMLLCTCTGGSAGADTATISISMSVDSKAGKAAVSIDQLTHIITLTGPTGVKTMTISGSGTAKVTVFPGTWGISVEGHFGSELYSVGSASAEVKAGQNASVLVQMTVVWVNTGGGGGGGGVVTPTSGVTVDPSVVFVPVGGGIINMPLTATVSGVPESVNWVVYDAGTTGSGNVTITSTGLLNVLTSAVIGTAIVRATTISGSPLYGDCIVQVIDPGDGSPTNPFKLYDAATLQRVGTEPAGTGSWSLNAYYALIQDITLPAPSTIGSSNFAAIGDLSTPFVGNFDGMGYKISNLIINELLLDYQGLFGCVDAGGVVVNLGLDGGSITAQDLVGGVAGLNNGTVENCYNTGTISGRNEAGGIVGNNGTGTVKDCYATGNVNGQGTLGGVAGSSATGSFVQNSYATGDVTGTSNTIGGVVGNNGGTVENCYATGNISGTTSIGGVVGSNSYAGTGGTVQYCYATGNVTGQGSAMIGNVGGVVGNNPVTGSTVKNCVALNSKVTLSTTYTDVARVVGINSGGTLNDNYARGDLVPGNSGGLLSISPGLTDPNGDDFSLSTSLAAVFDSGWSAWNNTSGNLAIGGALPTLIGVGGTQNPMLPGLVP